MSDIPIDPISSIYDTPPAHLRALKEALDDRHTRPLSYYDALIYSAAMRFYCQEVEAVR